jgi:Predicted membrane protein
MILAIKRPLFHKGIRFAFLKFYSMRSTGHEFSTWHTFLLGEENWSYIPMVILKSAIMFLVVLVSLRFIGRRGIMQGVFEVLTIIMLGSAAGDPMLYKNVGVLTSSVVFISIILLYKLTNLLVAKFAPVETIVEGRFIRIVKEGRFEYERFKSKELSKDNLFSDLRKKGVSQLGQVSTAYLEAGGEVSVFYYRDD